MKWLIPTLILAAGLLLSAKISPAKPEYTRRTHKDCEFCHPPDQPPEQGKKKANGKPTT